MTLSVNGDEVTISYKDFDMHVADSTVIQDICQDWCERQSDQTDTRNCQMSRIIKQNIHFILNMIMTN